jgi:hypothetical protein
MRKHGRWPGGQAAWTSSQYVIAGPHVIGDGDDNGELWPATTTQVLLLLEHLALVPVEHPPERIN